MERLRIAGRALHFEPKTIQFILFSKVKLAHLPYDILYEAY